MSPTLQLSVLRLRAGLAITVIAFVTMLMAGSLQADPKPTVTDPDLQNLVNDLYRPGASVGDGSTAAAIEHERKTGFSVGGHYHSQKGSDYSRAIDKWATAHPTASTADKTAAAGMKKALQDALSITEVPRLNRDQ